MWPPTYDSCCSAGGSSDPSTLVKFGGTQTDAFGRLRVSQPYTLFDSQQRYELDDNFVSNTVTGGTITYLTNKSSANLTVTGTTGSFAGRETKWVFPYQPGKSLLHMCSFTMGPARPNEIRQRVGYFGTGNGIFLELSDQLYIVRRSSTTGTPVDTKIAQGGWNYDTLNGTGISGITLDMTKVQIFWTDIEWLGSGSARVGFVINGQLFEAHVFHHANIVPGVYMTTGSLPVRYEIQTLSGTAPPSSNLTQICSTVISEGGYEQPFRLFSNVAPFLKPMTAGVWYPVVSISLAPTRLEAIAKVKQVDIVVTTADVLHWALWSNVTAANLTGASFVPHGFSTNVLVDRSATALSATRCVQVAAGFVAGTNQATAPGVLELNRYYSQIGRDSFTGTSRIFTLAFYSVTGVGGAGAGAQALLSWNELL